MKKTIKKCRLNMELLFVGFMLFLFAPLEIFFSNNSDLWFTVYDFVGYLLIGFIAYLVLIVIAEFIAAKKIPKAWDVIVYLIFLLGIAFYLQGNFFVVNYGQLDGQPIDWTQYKVEGVLSVSIFVVITVAGMLLLKKFGMEKIKKVTHTIAVCLILVQLVTLITVSLSNDGFSKKENYVVTTENEWEYSTGKNFNILVLDAFDSQVFNDLLQGECKEEIEGLFKDFTYYRNTTSVYTGTDFSIPQILTGEKYLNEELYGDYLENAYLESPMLNELQEKDYKLNIYQNVQVPQGEIINEVANWKKTKISVSSHRRLLGYLYKLVGFRYLPQPLKEFCWFYSDDMDDMKCLNYYDDTSEMNNTLESYNWSNKLFYENIENLTATDEQNIFHFYHLKGLHVIRNLDQNFNETEDASLEETAKAMFKMLNRYFDKLKEEGIYDNSVIIIMADHGAKGYPVVWPLLMVKGFGEEHDFSVSDSPVSYADLQNGYHNLLNETNTDNIFEVEDEKRIRYFYQADWIGRPLGNSDYSEDFVEYSVTGDAFESATIEGTGNVYSSR